MRAITKGVEPPSLTAHRQTPHCDYDNYTDKAALRRMLVFEQQGLCCYCMDRININKMKIEHWHSQSFYPAEQLRYGNLLGACLGGQDQPRLDLRHCDTHKGDQMLLWNPADWSHQIETRIRYGVDGSIRSDFQAFDAQLDGVLNLNIALLKNNRKAVLDAVLDWLVNEKKRRRGAINRARIEQERDRRIVKKGLLTPFCQIAIWWLDQLLAGRSK